MKKMANNDQEMDYQLAIQETTAAYTIEKPQLKSNVKNRTLSDKWGRDPKIARELMQKNNFKCEVDPNHITFISNGTGKNFMEAHHLIPMQVQDDFDYLLDVPGNIASLCPNCHRAIHHAVPYVKKKLIEQLYKRKKLSLRKYGLDISLDQIYTFYEVK